MGDPNATPYPFDCEPESKVAKCDVEAMERKLAEYETAARMRAMTSERELEALARDCVDAYAETVGEGWQQPATKGMRAVIELIARRLQPARVPEGWREAAQKACNRIKRLALECPHGSRIRDDASEWAGELDALLAAAPAAERGLADAEDSAEAAYLESLADDPALDGWAPEPHRCRAQPAPESREAETMRDWSARMAKAEAGQYVGAGSHGIDDKPEAGQREGVEEIAMRCGAHLDRARGAYTLTGEQLRAVANRIASAQQAGSSEKDRDPHQVWPEFDRVVIDAWKDGGDGLDLDLIACRKAMLGQRTGSRVEGE